MKKRTNFAKPMFVMMIILTIFALAAICKVTSEVLMPVTMAVLFSCVFEPIIILLKKKFHVPWGIGIFTIFVIVIVIVTALIMLLSTSIQAIAEAIPKYTQRLNVVYKTIASLFKLDYNPDLSIFSNLWQQMEVRQQIQNFVLTLSNSVISFFKVLGLIVLFSLFFLVEMRYLREKIEYAFGHTGSGEGRVSKMITAIIEQTTRYLSVKFTVSVVTGILVFICLTIIGIDFPIIWAFLAFVLNFIPTFGSIISVLLTSMFGVIQFFPQPGPMIAIFIIMVCTNFAIGNIVEPKIMGRNLGLSPFVIIVALTFWGWLWGFAGMIIGVPMMVILKIVCENVDFLEPVGILLGSYIGPKTETKTESETKTETKLT
ncbi:MAG: AI-2E family transporter [Treponema sp. CETP13]|nr:MAG: AI-2E family transporter [Treponema sp. CETP13]